MRIDQAQVIDRSVATLIIDSSAAKMKVGEHLTFIVTNEIHDIDFFWDLGIMNMILWGSITF
jgi:hypothetical protein